MFAPFKIHFPIELASAICSLDLLSLFALICASVRTDQTLHIVYAILNTFKQLLKTYLFQDEFIQDNSRVIASESFHSNVLFCKLFTD